MSVLPSGQSLTAVVPDLDSLLEDPASYLKAGAISIGPRKMYGLAAVFGLAGILCVASFVLTPEGDRMAVGAERLALGIGLLLAASVWLGWSLLLSGHELVMYPEGIEVRYRDTVVWCPWALFNTSGAPNVPDTDSPLVGLTLPINADAIPFTQLRREDSPIAHGAQIRCRQLVFTSRNEAVLPARYAASAAQLGQLLLFLGQKLGQHMPRGTPPPEAYRLEEIDQTGPIDADDAGWITVSLTRLHFPWRCCACGTETRHTRRQVILARADRILGPFLFGVRQLNVEFPTCESCDEQLHQQTQRGSRRGLFLGAVLVPVLITVVGLALRIPLEHLGLVDLLGLVIGSLAGLLIGTAASFRSPLQFRNYSPIRGTVQLRFRNSEQTEPFVRALRSQAENRS